MKRAVSQLSQKAYDIVVIGGGIYGACVARDAALRGLKVALVEQGDFGSATSANSHKIIHGGLRYLQHGDLKRMRESIRERSILLRIAPHLVFPLPVLIPTYRDLLQGKLVMSVALKLNDLVGFDRNRDLEIHKTIPPGRVVSKAECLKLCPDLEQRDLTGAALFFDAQVYNADRLTLSILISAARAGAVLANYAPVTGFIREGDTIKQMCIKDLLSGNSLEVRAKVFINCTGPWIDHVLQHLGTLRPQRRFKLIKAVVLVTRPLFREVAIGLRAKFSYKDRDAVIDKGHRYFFITPWRDRSLIGTYQVPYDGDPDEFKVTEEDIQTFIKEINSAYPGGGIERKDVYLAYGGLLPESNNDLSTSNGQPMKHYEIHDHAVFDGIKGLISVIGVKYTTARNVAEKTVNLVEKKLARKPVMSQTAEIPVHGGDIACFEDFLNSEIEKKPTIFNKDTLYHLVQTYGSE